MPDYRRAAHTIYTLHYHFVFITKYRKPVLRGDVGTEVRSLIREIYRSRDIEILQGHIRPDHVPATERAPAAVAESGDAGDQRQDVAPLVAGSPEAAGVVLGAASVRPWLLCVQ